MRTIYAASTAWTGPRPGSEALQVWAPSGPPPKRTGRLQNLQRHSWLKGAAGTGDIGDIKTSATFDCLRTEPDHLRWPCYRSWAASQVYCKHWPTMSKCCIKSRDFAPPKCLAQASPLASLQPWKMTIAFFLVNSGLVQAPKHPRAAGSRHRKASETCACFKICAERKACGSLGFSWMTWQEKALKSDVPVRSNLLIETSCSSCATMRSMMSEPHGLHQQSLLRRDAPPSTYEHAVSYTLWRKLDQTIDWGWLRNVYYAVISRVCPALFPVLLPLRVTFGRHQPCSSPSQCTKCAPQDTGLLMPSPQRHFGNSTKTSPFAASPSGQSLVPQPNTTHCENVRDLPSQRKKANSTEEKATVSLRIASLQCV